MLHFEIKGNGKPVVLVHGFMENRKMWDFLSLEDSGYQTIRIDLPGHGLSESEFVLHSMEYMADEIVEVLQKAGIADAYFISHSMGGYVTLALMERYPQMVKGLTLFFSSPFSDTPEKKVQRLRAVEAAQQNIDGFIKVGVPNLFNPNLLQDLEDEINIAKGWAKEATQQGIMAAILGMRERLDRTELVKKADIPIQMICGTFDSAIPTELLKKTFEGFSHISIKELPIGHMGHLEAPESCEKLILQFLQKKYV